jgi:hypothetical protein
MKFSIKWTTTNVNEWNLLASNGMSLQPIYGIWNHAIFGLSPSLQVETKTKTTLTAQNSPRSTVIQFLLNTGHWTIQTLKSSKYDILPSRFYRNVILHMACSCLPTNTWWQPPAFLAINVLQNLLSRKELVLENLIKTQLTDLPQDTRWSSFITLSLWTRFVLSCNILFTA